MCINDTACAVWQAKHAVRFPGSDSRETLPCTEAVSADNDSCQSSDALLRYIDALSALLSSHLVLIVWARAAAIARDLDGIHRVLHVDRGLRQVQGMLQRLVRRPRSRRPPVRPANAAFRQAPSTRRRKRRNEGASRQRRAATNACTLGGQGFAVQMFESALRVMCPRISPDRAPRGAVRSVLIACRHA